MKNPEDTPGKRLMGGAFAYLRAAKLLFEYDPEALAWATMFVNLGLSIELGLKGYLRQKGFSEQQQIALGHNLLLAFNKACNAGFKPTLPHQRLLIEELNPHYKDMTLRYLNGNAPVNLPPMDAAISVTERLIYDLHTQLPA